MLILQLWKLRERPSPGSSRWLKVWLKRLFTAWHLLACCWRQFLLRLRGARIEPVVFVAPAQLMGTPKNLEIGNYSFVGRVVFHLHDKIRIGRNVIVNDHVTLLTASHDYRAPLFPTTIKPIVVGDYAWIATGATVLPGVEIGSGAVIGAGSVVTRSVPDRAIVAGNPARVVGHRGTGDLLYRPTDLVGCIEAWIGRNAVAKMPAE